MKMLIGLRARIRRPERNYGKEGGRREEGITLVNVLGKVWEFAYRRKCQRVSVLESENLRGCTGWERRAWYE